MFVVLAKSMRHEFSEAHMPRAKSPGEIIPFSATPQQIVCATDFSAQSAQATQAATALAGRLHEPLVLLHAIDESARRALPGEVRNSLRSFERQRLADEAQSLRESGIEVHEAFCEGTPDAMLAESANAPQTRLVVLSSHGRKPPARQLPASLPERLAQTLPVPTLIVRSAAPLIAWARGERTLRVFVGADFSTPSAAALEWVSWLRRVGPCDVVVAYIESLISDSGPADAEHAPNAIPVLAQMAEVEERAFRKRVRAVLGPGRLRIRFEDGWGRSDVHLIEMAGEERADLMVVGTHQRHGLARMRQPSVSRSVIHYAPMNVACIPAVHAAGADG